MAHPVKCIYCKGVFDRDKEPYVQVSDRRYAHKHCAEKNQVQKTQSELDYEMLVNYIENLFGIDYVNAKIAKQIKDFRETYNYTYQGMLGTLVYWYEVRQSTLDKANGGIGIIPYIYDQAKEYYSTINKTNELNANIKNYKLHYKEIEIFAPRAEEKPVKLFDLGEDDNG
jgi:hypothetical protein